MEKLKKIDIHVHGCLTPGICRASDHATYATGPELRKIYDAIGVEKGVLLPSLNIECGFDIVTNEDTIKMVNADPDSFAWFCNLDPRMGDNNADTDFSYFLNYYKQFGAKGVGELCCNVAFDDPMLLNLFKHCEACNMPVIFHMGLKGNDYGLIDDINLTGLEKALAMFPKLRFLGHSQKFWACLSGNVTEKEWNGYPTGKVTPGGRVVELMERYPNLCCDLSAGSGYNAMTRDVDFTVWFMEKFQDRLYYGTDLCAPYQVKRPMVKLAGFLDDLMESGRISYAAYEKICRGNALKILK